MAQVSWDSTVFRPVSEKELSLGLFHTVEGTILTVKERDSPVSEVALLVKELLEKEVRQPLPERAQLFLRLHYLGKEVEAFHSSDLWIRVVHVLLLVATLGLFSFRDTMKTEALPLKVAKLFGVATEEEARICLQNALTFQDLYNLPPKMREEIVQELGCKAQYEEKKALLDSIHEKGSYGMQEKVAVLHGDLFADPAPFLQDRASLQSSIATEWKIEKIVSFFGGVEGERRWKLLFQGADARKAFESFSDEKLGQLFEYAEGNPPLLFVKEVDFFTLLSSSHWHDLKGKGAEIFRKLESGVDFSQLTISKDTWQLHLLNYLY